jgi:hypothetical protein
MLSNNWEEKSLHVTSDLFCIYVPKEEPWMSIVLPAKGVPLLKEICCAPSGITFALLS